MRGGIEKNRTLPQELKNFLIFVVRQLKISDPHSKRTFRPWKYFLIDATRLSQDEGKIASLKFLGYL